MQIREATEEDLPRLRDIMNYYRVHTSAIWDRTPLTIDDMHNWLEAHQRFPYFAIVAEEDGKLVGYASLSQFRPHSGYAPTAENSIYLAPEQGGKGYGEPLLKELLRRGKENGLKTITAWIDSENKPSIAFHQKMGFEYVGILKNAGILAGAPVSVVILQMEL